MRALYSVDPGLGGPRAWRPRDPIWHTLSCNIRVSGVTEWTMEWTIGFLCTVEAPLYTVFKLLSSLSTPSDLRNISFIAGKATSYLWNMPVEAY